MTYLKTQEIIEYKVSVNKENSSFLYFTLESNEGICFYSTLEFEKGSAQRDLVIYCTPELEQNLKSILKHLESSIELEIQSSQKIKDFPSDNL